MTIAAQATPAPGERYRILRELGPRARRTFAAIREPHELVVLQRFVRRDGSSPGTADVTRGEGSATSPVALPEATATEVSDEQIALLLRDARALETHWHPNIARVKHVTLASGDLRFATELIDGATLADLMAAADAREPSERARLLSLPVLLRMLVDVLGGLHGLHGLRDGLNTPLDAMHGELSPVNVVVGRDGVARLVAVLRPRPVRLESGSEATGYAAPEMVDAAATPDLRADVYAVGVMLWEAMRGARLYDAQNLAEVAQRQRTAELEPPTLPGASPFAALADVAMKALAFDPALRYRTASEMAAEVRRIAGTRLAPGSVVAQTVAELAGDRIRARRAELDPVASGTRRRASSRSMPAVDTTAIAEGTDKGFRLTPPAAPADAMPAAGYLVVPARPMLESVDSEALEGDGAVEPANPLRGPSTARLKVDGGDIRRPAPVVRAPVQPAPRAPNARAAPPSDARIEISSSEIELASVSTAAAAIAASRAELPAVIASDDDDEDGEKTAVGRPPPGVLAAQMAAPPPVPRRRTSRLPDAQPDGAVPSSAAPTSNSRRPSGRGVEDAAARAEIPRLGSESSHDLSSSTNVLEGDFIRALKAAASEPTNAHPSKLPAEPRSIHTGAEAVEAATVATALSSSFFPATSRALSMSVLDAEEEEAGAAVADAEGAAQLPPPPFATTPSFLPPKTATGGPEDARAEALMETRSLPDVAALTPTPGYVFPDFGADAGRRPDTDLPTHDLSGEATGEATELPTVEADAGRRRRARRIVGAVVAGCATLLVAALAVTVFGAHGDTAGATRPAVTATVAAITPAPPASSPASLATAAPAETAVLSRPDAPAEAPGSAEAAEASKRSTTRVTGTRPATARPVTAPAAPRPAAPSARPASRSKKPSYDPLGI